MSAGFSTAQSTLHYVRIFLAVALSLPEVSEYEKCLVSWVFKLQQKWLVLNMQVNPNCINTSKMLDINGWILSQLFCQERKRIKYYTVLYLLARES